MVHFFLLFASTSRSEFITAFTQGCQMVRFQTKNPNLGKFWSALYGKMLIYFMDIWNISRIFGIVYDHLAQFVFIWYIFSGFGNMHQEKIWQPCFYRACM
jgi:hypothetical protein